MRGAFGALMRIYGHSMMPLLRPGDLVWVDRAAYRRRPPRRGELIAARPAALGGQPMVKRIAAVPYEQPPGQATVLGPGEYAVIGDQPADSLDSRLLGPILQSEVLGRVWLRVWPPRLLNH